MLQSSSRYVVSQGLQGSCTACLLTINQASGQLHAANLGDSGFLVLGRPHPQRVSEGARGGGCTGVPQVGQTGEKDWLA